MLVTPATLLNAVSSAATGAPIALPPELSQKPLGVSVFGTFVGTVILEATVDTQAAVDGATATWAAITGASWTTPAVAKVDAPFTHIRARVSAYTSGSITLKVI